MSEDGYLISLYYSEPCSSGTSTPINLPWMVSRPTGSYPETLVLYRTRPVVEWQVDSGVGWGASDTAV